MRGDIIVKVKTGTTKKSIEHFGGDRYLVKTDLTETESINKEIIEMLSVYMGVPEHRIVLKSGLTSGDKVFQLVM